MSYLYYIKIEKQVADGSLYKDPTADLKPPPDNFSGSSLIAADPGAAAPVLSSGQVNSVAQVVSTETPSAQDLLKHIQEAEACSPRRPFASLRQLLPGSNKGNRDSFNLIVSSDRCTRPGARGAQAPWHSA
jgi:hypothetical protein